ncbi:MAG: hypothetical protein WCK76_11450 [Elusimicrobiota bacterium]
MEGASDKESTPPGARPGVERAPAPAAWPPPPPPPAPAAPPPPPPSFAAPPPPPPFPALPAALPPAYSVQEFLVGRIGSAETRLSAAEAAVNELTARAAMHERLSGSDIAAARERLADLEKKAVTPEYVDKRTAALEDDAARIRTLEGQLAAANKKIEKLEAASQVLQAEQARAAENEKDSGAALEELRAQFASMSVLFNHLRGSGLSR